MNFSTRISSREIGARDLVIQGGVPGNVPTNKERGGEIEPFLSVMRRYSIST